MHLVGGFSCLVLLLLLLGLVSVQEGSRMSVIAALLNFLIAACSSRLQELGDTGIHLAVSAWHMEKQAMKQK